MRSTATTLLLISAMRSTATTLLLVSTVNGLAIPSSPAEQTRRAITSIRSAILEPSDKPKRLFIDYLIPLPAETKEEDIDPWPGGLAQMYPYAEDIIRDILKGVVNEAGQCSSQVLSAPDCCGFFIQESQEDPKKDVAAILFPSVDQLDDIERIDEMVGPDRTLILMNKQFQRPADFGFTGMSKSRSRSAIFDRFKWGFAFQELACRGEDVKLTFEHPNWYSCAVCDEDVDLGSQQIKLLEPQLERPAYEALEAKINEVLPEPLWMRKMGEAKDKGLKFQR